MKKDEEHLQTFMNGLHSLANEKDEHIKKILEKSLGGLLLNMPNDEESEVSKKK